MEFNLERVRSNVRNASTEDLLDRVTIFRGDMEPAALEIIDRELMDRGITSDQVRQHVAARGEPLTRKDGSVVRCSFCYKPATIRGWGWHRLLGIVPIFPRRFAWCDEHQTREAPK